MIIRSVIQNTVTYVTEFAKADLIGINTEIHFFPIDCMGCQTDFNGRPGLPSELCQSGLPTDGAALPIVFECFL